MKPRRTFESVVSELIAGLETGEVTLGENRSNISVGPTDPPQLPLLFPAGTPTKSDFSGVVTQNLVMVLWSELLRAAKTTVEQRDVERTVAKTHHRIWLVVGADEESFDVLWKILLTSKVGSASHKKYDTRIIVSGLTPSHRDWIDKLQSSGLAHNIRVTTPAMDGWVAFADSNLYVDVPVGWRRKEGKDFPSPNWYSNTVDHHSLFAIEKTSHPDEFRNLERSFLDLWEVASDR